MALWEQADIPGFVALLREDAWFTMPPLPVWYQGRAAISTVLATYIFTPGRKRRLLPRHANGCPAFGLYQCEPGAEDYQLLGLIVLGIEGEQVASLVAFLDPSILSHFDLPSTLAPNSSQIKANFSLVQFLISYERNSSILGNIGIISANQALWHEVF